MRRLLADQVEVTRWCLVRSAGRRPLPRPDKRRRGDGVLDDGAGETIAAMRALLATDIGDQRIGPLEIVRRSVQFPTQALADRWCHAG